MSTGWFAYAPLTDAGFTSDGVFVTDRQLLGAAIGRTGIMAAAGIGDFALGRRRGATT